MGHVGLIPCITKTNQNVTVIVTFTVTGYLYVKSLENIAVARNYLWIKTCQKYTKHSKADKTGQQI